MCQDFPNCQKLPGFIRTTSVLLIGLTMAACVNFKANYLAPLYGEAANDNVNVRPGNQPIEIPDNASSISQGFYPAPENREPGDYPQNHAGIDIVAKPGTPVLAAADGTIKSAFFEPLFGHQMMILHDKTFENSAMKSKYLHLRRRMVSVDEEVVAGQQIGELGSTGFFAAFPHLHFEVRQDQGKKGWKPLSPHLFWQDGIGIVSCFQADSAENAADFSITYPVRCHDG